MDVFTDQLVLEIPQNPAQFAKIIDFTAIWQYNYSVLTLHNLRR